jgi:glycosyltransferase involved in cell wall biosynthesis
MAIHEDHSARQYGDGKQSPALSVTVLNYNYAHYLPQCLESILSQTWKDFELILINDRSTDNSLEVIQPYLSDGRVRLVDHDQNQGYIASLIEGSNLSQGKYITVISADDFCVSDRAFESLLRPMEEDDEVVLAYAAHGHFGPDGICRYHRRPHPNSYVRSGVEEFCELVMENCILHTGTMIRTTAYHAVGGYDPHARYAPDSIMWLTLCGEGKVAYCADELYAYRVHDQSMSVSTRGIRDGMYEGLAGLEQAFHRMEGSPGVDRERYVRAMKRNLTAVATDNIFSNRLRSGWYAYWCGLRVHPLWTVFQTRTAILLARTVLGPRYFTLVHDLFHARRRAVIPA